jgi:hypothetical protein
LKETDEPTLNSVLTQLAAANRIVQLDGDQYSLGRPELIECQVLKIMGKRSTEYARADLASRVTSSAEELDEALDRLVAQDRIVRLDQDRLCTWRRHLKLLEKPCAQCGTPTRSIEELSERILCKNCRGTGPFAYVTKTRALREYRLAARELEQLPHLVKRNPHYSSAAPMRLFLRGHLE